MNNQIKKKESNLKKQWVSDNHCVSALYYYWTFDWLYRAFNH